jgi:hypothetical protein
VADGLLLIWIMSAPAMLLSMLATAAGPGPGEQQQPPPAPGIIAEVAGGVNAPLGPLGLALTVPWGRLTLGAGIGFQWQPPTGYPGDPGSTRLRPALFARFAVLAHPRYRLAIQIGLSEESSRSYAQRAPDRQLLWSRSGQSRYDAGVLGELGVGPTWVGLEIGVGRTGQSECLVEDTTTRSYLPCAPADTAAGPSSWIPFLALNLRHRDGATPALETEPSGPRPEGDTPRTLRIFHSGSPMDSFEVFADGSFQGSTEFSGGLEGDVVLAPSPHFRIGLGLRYELAHGPASSFRGAIDDHFLYALLLLGGAIPLAGRHELEIQFGLGVLGGLANDGPSSFVQVLGPTAEIALTYWIPATRALDVSVGAALSVSVFEVVNSDQFEGSEGGRLVLPLRVGARWSL